MTRRSLFKRSAAFYAGSGLLGAQAGKAPAPSAKPLKDFAQRTGRLLGVFSGQHELMTDPEAAKTIAREFDLLAIGNDLKMDRVRPTPDTYDFSYGDWDVAWSQRNGLHFRGHTLVWHNALPKWFRSYVSQGNARRVMTDHITTVMKHYAGKIYSWDVVNEVVRTTDNRPDGLRAWPWLKPIGPEYIDIAFRTAAAADPNAKLILNENNFEHDLPDHAQRRKVLLQLLTRLKNNNVPITGLGTQGHIRADTPFAKGAVKDFYTAVRDLGLDVMITEVDVDDSGIPAASIDDAVARTFAEYLDLVGPFASSVTFGQFSDSVSLLKRSDGLTHRPNLFDTSYQKKPAYKAAAHSLESMPTIQKTHSGGPAAQ